MISTHVLDTERGGPAAGLRVQLFRGEVLIAERETDDDGRIRRLADVEPGTYRLVFHPASPFFRRVEAVIEIEAGRDHHVPLLLSPYACTIYRGS
ncbi:MAG TPA: hydroxyisourate hydrolase [Gaiellaceae bacterium]